MKLLSINTICVKVTCQEMNMHLVSILCFDNPSHLGNSKLMLISTSQSFNNNYQMD